jgi:hypothetical protein
VVVEHNLALLEPDLFYFMMVILCWLSIYTSTLHVISLGPKRQISVNCNIHDSLVFGFWLAFTTYVVLGEDTKEESEFGLFISLVHTLLGHDPVAISF